jgi:hypothetical protein
MVYTDRIRFYLRTNKILAWGDFMSHIYIRIWTPDYA